MSTTARMKDIDVLRGIAIIFVLIQHTAYNLIYWNQKSLFEFYDYCDGTVGVALFFVISGFLITKLYLSDFQKENKTTTINNALLFWCRRGVRLFPAALFWLLAVIAGSLFSKSFGSVKASLEGAFAALFQIANFRFMSCFGHYECGLNVVHWTLSLEQQFYFIFPFLVYFTKKKLAPVLGLLLVLQLFSASFEAPFGFRFSGFVIGILIGILSKSSYYTVIMPRFLNKSLLTRIVLFTFLIVALTFSMGKNTELGTQNLKYNLATFISGILVLIASYNQSFLLPQSRVKSLLLFIGERSYSYYLCHMFCFVLAKIILQPYYPQNEPNALAMFIYMGVAALFCGVFGEFSYRILEVNFKKRAQPYINTLKMNLPSDVPQTLMQDMKKRSPTDPITRQSNTLVDTL